MKKTVSIMTISLLTSTTLITASPSEQMDLSTLNKIDAQVLFGRCNVNTLAMNQNEMSKTEGKFFWAVLAGVALWNIGYANAPALGDRTYSGTLINRPNRRTRRWHW